MVDDEPAVCIAIDRTLTAAGHTTVTTRSVEEARAALVEDRFDVVLCDINLAGDSGLDLVHTISRELVDVAVVMVTAVDDPAVARQATTLGAYGYLVKPFTPNEILIAAESALRRKILEQGRRMHIHELETKLLDRSASLSAAFRRVEQAHTQAKSASRETAERLTLALTLRDEETGHHIERVGRYAALLAQRAGVRAWRPEDIELAAMLHDVGKIGVPDDILLRPGPLSAEERAVMERHSVIGQRLLEASSSDVLRLGASVAASHHERWDGTGYPLRLPGNAIPLEGRVTAVADSFDALTSDRAYRPGLTVEAALELMAEERGRQFDPALLDVFFDHLDEFLAIKADLPDRAPVQENIRLLVAKRHDMYTDSLIRMLDQAGGIVVVAHAPSVAESIELSRSFDADVVASDWELTDGTAADLAVAIRRHGVGAAMVVLVEEPDDDVLLAAIEAGAAGCVEKQRGFEELVAAVRTVHEGETLVHPAQLTSLLRRKAPATVAEVRVPTAREREVLTLMADGLSTDAIAERLALSTNTVRNHVQRLLGKLGAHNRLEAVAAGVRAGLIERG